MKKISKNEESGKEKRVLVQLPTPAYLHIFDLCSGNYLSLLDFLHQTADK
ncbi:MAG TPA: hypothetical protein VK666_23880 [Chryseolinea sp.]|nr:hypothetical protein [Chryseolinea sp.]